MLATELGIKRIIAVKVREGLGMEVKLRIQTEIMAIQEVIVEGENVAEEVDIEDEQEGREDHPNRHDVRFRSARGELFFFLFFGLWKRTRKFVYHACKYERYFDRPCIYQVDRMRIVSLEIMKQLSELLGGFSVMPKELEG